jgi:hypothetical protein
MIAAMTPTKANIQRISVFVWLPEALPRPWPRDRRERCGRGCSSINTTFSRSARAFGVCSCGKVLTTAIFEEGAAPTGSLAAGDDEERGALGGGAGARGKGGKAPKSLRLRIRE